MAWQRRVREAVGMFDPRYLNARSTMRTSIGFVRTLLGRGGGTSSLDDVFNHVRISDRLSTAGQPTAEQFRLVRDAGFTTVVNLAPHGHENAIADEPGVVADLGMAYVHIPVDFEAPGEDDYARFREVLDASDEPVFVHCAANMRVSAFVYRWRVEHGEDETTARRDLHRLWKPFGVWAEFVSR